MAVVTRRDFLAASALTLSAATYAGAAAKPNDRVRVAVMGCRVRGKQLLPVFAAQPNVEITHVIDPDESLHADAAKLAKTQETPPKTETDVRKVLEDPSVTALVVAAPDHWHALATVWACQAGKHVYCEKPCSHNLVEGRRMVQAARKYKKVVQIGTQRRSATDVAAAREYVQAGKLGKVAFARAWIAGNRPNIGKAEPAPVPKGVDYSLWLGPAAEGPFTKNRFHYTWHWFWDLGTGEIGNNGIHGLDMARNVLGVDAPTRISCAGGKYWYDDDQQTPDTQIATFDFPAGPGGAAGCTLLWEHRVWEKKGPEGQSFGVILHGDKGTLLFTEKGWEVRGGDGTTEKPGPDIVGAHVKNFLDCVRDGKTPNADIEEGHKSTRLCHLGNIAYRTGRTLHFDAATETFKDDPAANQLLGREYRKGFELPAV
ncbi:MAG: nagA 5 [Gemmataceae bacterium]|nr:nagA 5 [Gemmataceae bacterium]